jgi:uncharacterized protein YggE
MFRPILSHGAFMPTPRHLLVPTLALAASLAALPPARADEERAPRSVTVSATATVTAEPDLAHVTAGVTSEADSAREALDRNTEAMALVIAGLKAGGIDAKDIATSSFNVHPRYSNPPEGAAPAITGYRVSNQVHVTVRELARVGDILDRLVGLGANEMGGLSFEVSKAETLRDEARRQAMANALRRARLFAEAAGASVGEVLWISEDVSTPPVRPVPMARAARAEMVPVEPGTQELEARVTASWALQ